MHHEYQLQEGEVEVLLERAVFEHLVNKYDSSSTKKPEAGEQNGYREPKLDEVFVSDKLKNLI